ncbi:phage tail protein [Phreatobacter sp. HK31-P]
MSNVLLGLGPFAFYTTWPSFQKLKHKVPIRWIGQERAGRRPAMQFLGPGEETVTIEGVFYPHALGGMDLLLGMQNAAREGQILDLAASTGEVFGPWVIKDASNDDQFFTSAGVPRKVDFTVELHAYGEDEGGFAGGIFDLAGALAGATGAVPVLSTASVQSVINRVSSALQNE